MWVDITNAKIIHRATCKHAIIQQLCPNIWFIKVNHRCINRCIYRKNQSTTAVDSKALQIL